MIRRAYNKGIKMSLVAIAVASLVLYVLTSLVNVALAQPNLEINYQGKLTDTTGVAVENDDYNIRFFLYDTVGVATTSAIWTEEWLVSGNNGVPLQNGLFSVMLGSTTPLTSVDFNQTLYLGVEIGGTTTAPTWDGEMSPRKRLGTVPSAFEAQQLGGLATTSFLRADQADTLEASSSGSLLTLIQNGAGAILSAINSSAETVFSVFDSGIVTVGTSTDANIATSTGLAVYNKDLELLPGDPVKVGGISSPANSHEVVVRGNLAYVVGAGDSGAGDSDEFEIFDISDPINPFKVGGGDADDAAYDIAVTGNYAYVVSELSGDDLEIFDVSDPTNPVKVGAVNASESLFGVTISGNFAYTVGYGDDGAGTVDEFEIFDISDPTNPIKVGGGDAYETVNDIAVVGNFAYLVTNFVG
jgi:hypothetical protein